MNLYQQFVMRPPDKARMGARLLDNPRDVAKPMTVRTSRAPYEFYDRGNVVPRGTVTQPAAYGLPANMGFAGLGALGAWPLNPQHVWTMEDLLGSTERAQKFAAQSRKLTDIPDWTPVSQSTLKAAQDAWSLMEQLSSGSDSLALSIRNKLTQWGNALESAAQTVDSTWDHVIFGWNVQTNPWGTQRVQALERIKSTFADIISQGALFQKQLAAEQDAEAKRLEEITAGGGSLTSRLNRGSTNSSGDAATAGEGSGVDPKLAIAGIAGLGLAVLVIRKVMKKS